MRTARGSLSLRAFEKLTKVSVAAIRKIELGETNEPKEKTLRKLAPYVGHSVQELRNIASQVRSPEARNYRTMEDLWPIVDNLPSEELVRLVQRAAAKLGNVPW